MPSPPPPEEIRAGGGGGVAGMEAARCAALRGHDVTLCEGSDRLGGNLIPAGAHPFKEELNELNRWYQGQLAQLGVTVELGVRLTAREIQDRSPDAVVLAVGAAPAVPPVPGIDSPKVIDCVTALTGPDLPGQRVLVVGGGLVGCETALGYAQAGKQVTILEALPDILSAGIPVPEMNDSMLRDLLDEAGVVRRTGRRLSRVTEDGAVADGPDGEEKLSADHIVLAVGFAPGPPWRRSWPGREWRSTRWETAAGWAV
ncbi:MAG: FAD-dependent oxidoreductase [Evtepia gabavorous]